MRRLVTAELLGRSEPKSVDHHIAVADAQPMSLAVPVDELEAADLVALLAGNHRYFPAYQRLLTVGMEASEAARQGLRHPDPQVRIRCCQVLDHVMDEAGLDALLAVLDDPAPEVRIQALHALACDRCKQDACRQSPAAVLPRAVSMLAGDPHPRVRAGAAEVVGAWVHSQPLPGVRAKHAAAQLLQADRRAAGYRSLPTSTLSLLGLVRHVADVGRT